MTVNTIYNLLGRLENIIIAKGIRLLPLPYAIVNVKNIEDVLDRIRVSIPGEIQEAREILRRKDEILMEAQNKADHLYLQAQDKARSLIDEAEILKAVRAEAERIKTETLENCEAIKRQTMDEIDQVKLNTANEVVRIREGADKYAEEVLGNLDRNLQDLHGIVKNGQQYLTQLKSESIAKVQRVSTPQD
jgi:cell division septum initiation protein DivIVA